MTKENNSTDRIALQRKTIVWLSQTLRSFCSKSILNILYYRLFSQWFYFTEMLRKYTWTSSNNEFNNPRIRFFYSDHKNTPLWMEPVYSIQTCKATCRTIVIMASWITKRLATGRDPRNKESIDAWPDGEENPTHQCLPTPQSHLIQDGCPHSAVYRPLTSLSTGD